MRILSLIAIASLAACGDTSYRSSLVADPSASVEDRDACALTERKCTRCHTLEPVLAFEANTRAEWEPIVLRMRRMASSGISSTDASAVLRCLGGRR